MAKSKLSKSSRSALSRRDFLIRSTAAGTATALTISFGTDFEGIGDAEAAGMRSFNPSIFFTIMPDGKTNMHIVKAEMGQHIGTALAQIMAEELEVDWNDVTLDYPEGSLDNFNKFGLMHTANSGSVTTEFERLSRAGAAGRMLLVEAGAKLLGAAPGACYASKSTVIEKESGRSVTYSEILSQTTIDRTFSYPDDFHDIPTKPREEYKLIGKSLAALDIPGKTNGKAQYGIDVFLPDMVYGSLVIPRTRFASKVVSVDDTQARKIPGFVQAVTIDDSSGNCTGWVVAVAEKFPAAVKAAKALKVTWDPGPYGEVSSEDLAADHQKLQKDPNAGAAWVLQGDVDAALSDADEVLEWEFTSDMVVHAPMEPLNATVGKFGDTWHVWQGTQSTTFGRMTLTGVLSAALGVEAGEMNVVVHPFILGGGFGGKQDYDEVVAAALASHAVGRPVKLIQTRESQMATSFPRTPSYHVVRAGLKDGELSAMEHDIVGGWLGARYKLGREYGTDWLQQDAVDDPEKELDQWTIGGSDHWYNVPNERVRGMHSERTTIAMRASALRSVSNSFNYWVVESCIDDIAHRLNRDPVEFRLSLLDGKGEKRGIPNAGYPPGTPDDYYIKRLWTALPAFSEGMLTYESATVGGAKRLANVLKVATGKAGYGIKALAKNSGMGVAVSGAEERESPTWVAGVAEVSVEPTSGEVLIEKLTIAMDMGLAINPDNVADQIRGSALWGASQILSERLTMTNGSYEQLNFDTYKTIRLRQVPEIDVELIESGHHPTGVGEPASSVIAPAVANAVFDAVGHRALNMPIDREALLRDMRKT